MPEEIKPQETKVIEPIKDEQSIQFPPSRNRIRVFALIAVLFDGLYSPLMLQMGRDGFVMMLNELGVDLSDEIKSYVGMVAVPFALCNLVTDLYCHGYYERS